MRPMQKITFLFFALILAVKSSAFAEKQWPQTTISIPEEKGVLYGDHTISNERDFYLIEPFVASSEGAILSIGSMRGLMLVGSQAISQPVIQLDYDRAVLAVNNALSTAIRHASNRFELIAELLNRSAPALVAQAASGGIAEDEFIKQLVKMKSGGSKTPFAVQFEKESGLPWETQTSGIEDAQPLATQFRFFLEELWADSLRWENTLWGSDAHFFNVKQGVESGLVLNVLSNLASPAFLESLKTALNQLGRKIALLDFSNALDHMIGMGFSVENLVTGLEQLPYSDSAKVLITFQNHPKHGHDWTYYLLSVNQLVQAKNLGLLKNFNGYFQLLKQLQEGKKGQLLYQASPELVLLPPKPSLFKRCKDALSGWIGLAK